MTDWFMKPCNTGLQYAAFVWSPITTQTQNPGGSNPVILTIFSMMTTSYLKQFHKPPHINSRTSRFCYVPKHMTGTCYNGISGVNEFTFSPPEQ